jgi:hypothetical protein
MASRADGPGRRLRPFFAFSRERKHQAWRGRAAGGVPASRPVGLPPAAWRSYTVAASSTDSPFHRTGGGLPSAVAPSSPLHPDTR